ncbi:phosphoribosylformylglycinamidine synthase subunit PurS [Terrabacter sp. BE26]|uniref:phosphoribosylformylglycinamidine synthase subunit PurS n=1 Tax=Terrabacter sp. BE26 TaxID=2898152 RepID=UPI0035BE8C48
MGSIVVDVMLKPEILDPQGQAVGGALPRLGFNGFTDVRQGKRFVLSVDGDVTDEHLAAAREAAEKLLSNPVIEDVVSVHVLDGGSADRAGSESDESTGAGEAEGDAQ